jgi:hypothetical protein
MALPPNLINATVINGKSDLLIFKDLSDPAIIKENPKDSGKIYKINVLKLFKLPLPPGSSAPDAYMEFYLDNAGITNASTLRTNANYIWKRKYVDIDPYFKTSVEYIISRESVIYLPEGKSLYLIKNGLTGGLHFSLTLSYEEIS